MIDDLLNNVSIAPLRIKDSKALRDNKLIELNSHDADTYLHYLIESIDIDAYVIWNDSLPIAFARLRHNDISNISASIEISFAPNSEEYINKILDDILIVAFFEIGLHKVSIRIPITSDLFAESLLENGFTQESILRDECIIDGVYSDMAQFYLLRPEYKNYNFAFVPFQRGIFLVGGGVDYVDKAEFYSYEETIEDSYIRDCADYLGIVDAEGRFYKRNSSCYSYDESDLSYLPAEVIRAFTELKEYFLKSRETFDINVILRNFTEFQISVLNELKTIPYGSTCSYEDIALRLSANDISKARKLTRAVGNACGANTVPILIPCHRVIGKNGMLVGFSGGIEFKDFLLQNEMFSSMTPLN